MSPTDFPEIERERDELLALIAANVPEDVARQTAAILSSQPTGPVVVASLSLEGTTHAEPQ